MSFMFCLKQTCYQILVFLRLKKVQPKLHAQSQDYYDQRQQITLNDFYEQQAPKSKPSLKTNTQNKTKPIQSKQQTKSNFNQNLLQQTNLLIPQQPENINIKHNKSKLNTNSNNNNNNAINSSQSQLNKTQLTSSSTKPSQIPSKVSRPIKINTQSFKINLQSYQNYYEIIQKKTENLQLKLNTPSNIIEIQKTNSCLQIRHIESNKLNIFIYQFKLPCTYSFYSQMLNDYSLQKRIDPNIDEFKMLQLYANNLRLNYLSYKKVLIVSPRDFVYLKYTNNVNNQYWDVSFSIPWQTTQGKVRGEILLNSCKIIEKEQSIEVQVYSEIDMKLSVSAKITKNQAVNEIKKYVEKCEKYVKENYRRELV